MYVIKKSTQKNKKYMAVFKDKIIHFGDNRHQHYKDKTSLKLYSHLDHGDEKRRKSYFARHGEATKYSAKYFSHKFLWSS